jgi:hypothetical protein
MLYRGESRGKGISFDPSPGVEDVGVSIHERWLLHRLMRLNRSGAPPPGPATKRLESPRSSAKKNRDPSRSGESRQLRFQPAMRRIGERHKSVQSERQKRRKFSSRNLFTPVDNFIKTHANSRFLRGFIVKQNLEELSDNFFSKIP